MPRKPDLRVCADHAGLSRRAAEAAVGTINDAVRTAGTCSIVLAGGSTPRRLYSLLASDFRSQISWVNVQVFWGDERYVPPEDARSNFQMAKETLLDHVPCPPANTFNRADAPNIVDHYTYVLASAGDLMEGVAAEAASLAGTLRLGRLKFG